MSAADWHLHVTGGLAVLSWSKKPTFREMSALLSRPQECARCCAAMLDLGAAEDGSPAALQLERHIQQFIEVRMLAVLSRCKHSVENVLHNLYIAARFAAQGSKTCGAPPKVHRLQVCHTNLVAVETR